MTPLSSETPALRFPELAAGESPHFSIVIPARDEEASLPAALESLGRALRECPRSCEVIVVINRCTDATEQIARSHGCRIVYDDSKNLSRIRNAGARSARGTILITIDADSTVSSNLLAHIDQTLQTGKYIGGGVLILPERWSPGIFLTYLLLLPIALYYRISAGLFFCWRDAFSAIHGFDEGLASAEDIDFAKRLRGYGATQGKRYASLLRSHIVTSCRKFDRFGDWYFVLHPRECFTLLRGKNQKLADKVWYDFER